MFQYLGKRCRRAGTVDEPRDVGLNTEQIFEYLLADQRLPDETFTLGHSTVGLQIPPTNGNPSSFIDEFFYVLKQFRVSLGNPLV